MKRRTGRDRGKRKERIYNCKKEEKKRERREIWERKGIKEVKRQKSTKGKRKGKGGWERCKIVGKKTRR